jgi:dihydroorotate dehydrogenase
VGVQVPWILPPFNRSERPFSVLILFLEVFEMCYSVLRPLIFRLDPEVAHHVSLSGLALAARLGPLNPMKQSPLGAEREVMGLRFPSPVGLAAGLDKDGVCIDGLAALGFGFIEIGTVTPKPQPGNPRPRLFRLPEAEAIINRMGFNNEGVDALTARVQRASYRGILGINIGKNKDTPVDLALDDYRIGLQKVYPFASYVTVNISSPNTPGLRSLQSGSHLEALVQGLMAERRLLAEQQGRVVPVAVKIAPDLEPSEVESIADCLLRFGVDGVIATNTTSSRTGVAHLVHGEESGGLSGRPVREASTAIVSALARHLNGRIPIIACGGIFSVDDAKEKLDAGASLVQVYSGFIYRGPSLVRELVKGLR